MESSTNMDKSNRLEFLENYLLMNKICKFQTLLKKTNSSPVTLRRDLYQLKAITSYSHKGQYITLAASPVYNDDGTWEYNSIMFTKFKNSYELILNIIERATNGITQEEISKKINLNISKQIQVLLGRNQLNRVKVRREYFYISNKLVNGKDTKLKLLRINQLEEYCDVNIKTSDLIALLRMVLAESKLQLKHLSKLLKKHSINLSVEKAEQIILKYDLIQKKRQ